MKANILCILLIASHSVPVDSPEPPDTEPVMIEAKKGDPVTIPFKIPALGFKFTLKTAKGVDVATCSAPEPKCTVHEEGFIDKTNATHFAVEIQKAEETHSDIYILDRIPYNKSVTYLNQTRFLIIRNDQEKECSDLRDTSARQEHIILQKDNVIADLKLQVMTLKSENDFLNNTIARQEHLILQKDDIADLKWIIAGLAGLTGLLLLTVVVVVIFFIWRSRSKGATKVPDDDVITSGRNENGPTSLDRNISSLRNGYETVPQTENETQISIEIEDGIEEQLTIRDESESEV